jgi:putative membrane protein
MHNGDWNDGMGNGNWWWIPMMIMMVAFWGGLIWIGVTLLKRNHTPQLHAPAAPPMAAASVATPSKPTAQEILAERLARGEIEPADYRERVEALRPPPNT